MSFEGLWDVLLEKLWDFVPFIFFAIVILIVAHAAAKAISAVYEQFIKRKLGYTHFLKLGAVTLKIGVYFFAGIIIFVNIPGVPPDILQLLGVVLGGIVAFSSSTIIANGMSGILIDIIKPYREGDWVQFNKKIGIVKKIAFFHTEIESPKNEIITVPNHLAMNDMMIVNLSEDHFVVHSTVSIGYDTKREVVEDLLKKAAQKAGLANAFVFILELGNYAITYEANGMLFNPAKLIEVRSDLNKFILDEFNKARVEIMSPHYVGVRTIKKQMTVKSK